MMSFFSISPTYQLKGLGLTNILVVNKVYSYVGQHFPVTDYNKPGRCETPSTHDVTTVCRTPPVDMTSQKSVGRQKRSQKWPEEGFKGVEQLLILVRPQFCFNFGKINITYHTKQLICYKNGQLKKI